MGYGLSKLKVQKLVRQIEKADEAAVERRREHQRRPTVERVNDREREFMQAIGKRAPTAKLLRSGWPDFLVEHDGRVYAIEVKAPSDDLSDRQREMFEALERVGIKTYVWAVSQGRELVVPWRRWQRKRRGRPGPRTAELARFDCVTEL